MINEIDSFINNLKRKKIRIGKSNAKVFNYENKYILKISKDIESLEKEYNKTLFLYNHNLTSKPILFIKRNNKGYFLKEYLDGRPLIDKEFISNPNKLIDYIVEAFNLLKSLDKDNKEFIHGDMCLPNILVKNNKVSGFIDLEDSGYDDRWKDYAWILWSLKRNLKTNKYNDLLLDKLNIKFNKDKYNLYIPEELRKKEINMFKSSKKYIFNYIIYTILQLTWGIVQNALGILLFLILTIIKPNRKRGYYHGAIVSYWKLKFSMGLGMFIFFGHKDQDETYQRQVLVHEYGHTIQSIILGPLFFFLVAIPSTTWAFLPVFQKQRKEGKKTYFDLYCERWANELGEKLLKEPAVQVRKADQ